MTYTRYLLLLIFYLASPDIFADGAFDVVVTDKSKEYLGIIFGGSIGAVTLGGAGNPLLSKMFERFNFIIVTFGVLVLSYIGVVAAVNTAREGEAMGKKFSLWVPLRGLSGMLMMLPSPGTGYSVVQMTVIWVVLNGIGAANAVWNVVLDQLASGIKVVGQVELDVDLQDSINTLTDQILQMSVCQNVLNQLDINLTKNYGPVTTTFPTLDQSLITPQTTQIANANIRDSISNQVLVPAGGISGYTPSATINVGVPNNPVCGSISVGIQIDYTDPQFSAATALNYLQIKMNAIKAIFDAVQSATSTLSNPLPSSTQPNATLPQALPGTYQTAYQNYMAQNVQLVVTPKINDASSLAQQINILKSFGWIHAGGYYFSLTQGSKVNSTNAISLPTVNNAPMYNQSYNPPANPPTDNNNFIGPLNIALENNGNRTDLNGVLGRAVAFGDQDKQSSPGLPSLATGYPSTGNAFLNKVLKSILQGIRTPILKFFTTELTGQTQDPLMSIGSFGSKLMLAGETTTFALVVISSLTMLAVSAGSCLNPLPWAVNMLLFTIFPFIASVLVLLWAMGATLGIYVPMVPYLVFTATAIGWMLAVIEAVVGAPIIALGLVQPSGEELGKIAPALGILANIFLRPTLMIFGFVIAGSLLRAILTMINFGFIGALDTAVPYPTFFSIMPTLALYTFLVIAVVNQAFSIIYELPNKVLRYMGITPEGGTPEKIVSEAKGGMDKGAQAGQDVLKGKTDEARAKIDSQKAQGKGGGGGGGGGSGSGKGTLPSPAPGAAPPAPGPSPSPSPPSGPAPPSLPGGAPPIPPA